MAKSCFKLHQTICVQENEIGYDADTVSMIGHYIFHLIDVS